MVLAATRPLAAQCAMCNASAGASDVGRSLSLSVLFMLAALFVAVGCLVLLVRRAVRRADGGASAAGGEAGAGPPHAARPRG